MACPRCGGVLLHEPVQFVDDFDQRVWRPMHCLPCGYYSDELMEHNRAMARKVKKAALPETFEVINPGVVWWLHKLQGLKFKTIAKRLGVDRRQVASAYFSYFKSKNKKVNRSFAGWAGQKQTTP